MEGLRFMIDTAATHTVVDRKVIKALRLQRITGDSEIAAFGQVNKARQFHLPKLRVGPVYSILRLHCFEGDLSGLGVDGIIGADLLGRQTWLASCDTNEAIRSGSFTIDFKNRKVYFGVRQQLEHTVPLEASDLGMIVVVMIQGHPLRLAVDTGSYSIILYKESQLGWLDARAMPQGAMYQILGGTGKGKQVILPDMELGNSRWTNPCGILLDLPNQAKDGVLSVWQLGLRVVHFDFERKLMSWNK
jgi:predicted aspartyl protease